MDESTITIPSGELLKRLFIRLTLITIFFGILFFGTSGSIEYWNGWLFMVAFCVPMTIAFFYLYKNNRSLLEKRMRMREREPEQKTYVKLSLLWFLISHTLPGFDYRFGWSHVPVLIVVVSVIVMISGYTLFIVAMVQNSYASRIIEIQEHQRVIDTGLYSVVRHPMYMAATIMFVPSPLVLGSYYALIPIILLPLLLIYRIRNEEKVLHAGLAGYTEYANRVRFRLIPFIW